MIVCGEWDSTSSVENTTFTINSISAYQLNVKCKILPLKRRIQYKIKTHLLNRRIQCKIQNSYIKKKDFNI